MRAKYQTQTPKEILSDDEDQLILQIFAKHQVLGGTRNEACNELQRILQKKISEAALKLRFYRLVQKKGIHEEQLLRIGQDVLKQSGIKIPDAPILQGEPVYTPQQLKERREGQKNGVSGFRRRAQGQTYMKRTASHLEQPLKSRSKSPCLPQLWSYRSRKRRSPPSCINWRTSRRPFKSWKRG